MENLIIVKQLPVIEEHLKSLSIEIEEKVNNALALIVSEDTVKDVKNVRAELNSDFKQLEIQRKMVKEKIMNSYQEFEGIYKRYVSDKYKNADLLLKDKIDDIETNQKNEKAKEINEYYKEYAMSMNLEWLCNEMYFKIANINITLSASKKSLKEQVKLFIDKVNDDMQLIDTQAHNIEIIAEYKKNLNVSNAITCVNDRFKREEEERKKIEDLKKIKEEESAAIRKVDAIATPITTPIERDKHQNMYNATFRVYGTIDQLKQVKGFLKSMKKEGLRYE